MGSVSWTATAESLADLNDTFAPLAADDGYLELLGKGVSRDVIDVVLGERAPDADVELAKRALSRPMTRWATLEPRERKRKIHTYLAARGFDYTTIEEVTRAATADDPDE